MQQQEQQRGPLSENELMQKLAGAKKIMNIVDKGEYTEGHIDESKFTMPDVPTGMPNQVDPQYNQTAHLSPDISKPVGGVMNEERIRSSKLPDAIKEAMIRNPIAQPTIDATQQMDMKIFEGARRLMKEDNGSNKKPSAKQYSRPSAPASVNSDELISKLTPLIESTIRKVLDEKLTQILSAHDTGTINENLAIKVGDSIFHGKITKVKSSK